MLSNKIPIIEGLANLGEPEKREVPLLRPPRENGWPGALPYSGRSN